MYLCFPKILLLFFPHQYVSVFTGQCISGEKSLTIFPNAVPLQTVGDQVLNIYNQLFTCQPDTYRIYSQEKFGL